LGKKYNMEEELKKALEIIKEYKDRSNNDLLYAMEKIKLDFDHTKNTIFDLTKHMDDLEYTFNLLLKEYQRRTKT